MTPLEMLKNARAHIEKGWVQGPTAVNENGSSVPAIAPTACRWCSYGALVKENEGKCSSDVLLACENLLEKAIPDSDYTQGYINWQEEPGRKKEEVLAMFDQAIELASLA